MLCYAENKYFSLIPSVFVPACRGYVTGVADNLLIVVVGVVVVVVVVGLLC